MWWDKKNQPATTKKQNIGPAPVLIPKLDNSMTDNKPAGASVTGTNQKQTILGPSMTLNGELSGNEDLLIEGQFEGNVHLQDHCLTVGPHGQVKAEIHARQVVVLGSVDGNISASEKIEIRKSGRVVGDLAAAGVAIEEGAYLKGSIDIKRGDAPEPARSLPTPGALKTSA